MLLNYSKNNNKKKEVVATVVVSHHFNIKFLRKRISDYNIFPVSSEQGLTYLIWKEIKLFDLGNPLDNHGSGTHLYAFKV